MENTQGENEHDKSMLDSYGPYDPKLDLSRYRYPAIELLDHGMASSPVRPEELDRCKEIILQTLNFVGITVTKIKATVGPRLTLYEIVPGQGIRIAQVMATGADLALRLGLSGVKVIGALAGKGTIGIEVPHLFPAIVYLRPLLSTEKFLQANMELPLAMGRTMDNELFMLDLIQLPHLLIAGATGQGKSVAINAILTSLLFKKHPAEMKLVLIDFNRLEFSPFGKIERHFLAKLPDMQEAIISNIGGVMETLNSLIRELDQRYDMFNKAHVRSIQEYNRQYISRKITDPEQHRYLPYFVVVIDEFADLATARVNAFPLIIRIAKLGRPAGVHLIIATQRPSVNIITGDIKANFTARLVCKVATSTDSRTIIDNGGAEKLEGDGDMLFYAGHQTTRLQGAWVTTEEVLRLAEYIGAQQGYPTAMYLPEYPADVVAKLKFDPDTLDPFFAESALLIVIHQQGSRSLIQRKLKLGYNRAGRIIDQLEAAGVVGPSDGAKARDVLFTDEDALQTYLKTIMPAAAEPAVVKQAPLPTPISVPAPEPKKGILSWLFKR